MELQAEVSLIIDVGTNAEFVLEERDCRRRHPALPGGFERGPDQRRPTRCTRGDRACAH